MSTENTDPPLKKTLLSLAQEHKATKDAENHRRETLKNLVRQQVLRTLGQPGDLLKVQVRPLWDRKYRVNVFVGAHFASAKVAKSYFVVADSDGNILEATPKIEKQY